MNNHGRKPPTPSRQKARQRAGEPNPSLAAGHAQADNDSLRTENARLQERVKELESPPVCSSDVHCLCQYAAATAVERAELKRDRYKALAERWQKKFLSASRTWHNFRHTEPYRRTESTWEDCTEEMCVAARADAEALEEKP